MTISSATARADYSTNGTTGPFTVPFYFLDNSHLRVIYKDASGNETTLALDAGYTVTGAGVPSGGTVTTATAYAAGGTLTIIRDVPATQETDYTEGGDFPAETHEAALDKLTMIVQQQQEVLNRALVMSEATTGSGSLPDVAERADKLLSFNSIGEPVVSAPVSGSAADLAVTLASSSGSSLVGHSSGELWSATRTVKAKLNDVVSVLDGGADPTGVSDSSGAFEDVAQWCIANGRKMIVPGGRYKFLSPWPIVMSGTDRGLVIEGDSGNDLLANTGSILDFSAISGQDGISVTAGSAQAFTSFRGLTFVGSSTVNHGLHYTAASYANFELCNFYSFQKSLYAAVRFTAGAGQFVGIVNFNRCGFEANANGVHVVGDVCNVFNFHQTVMLDHTGTAILFGNAGTVQQNRVINIDKCTLEGNVRDFLSNAALYALNITGNYIENNNNAHTAPRIELANDGTNASSGAVVITGNQFQKSLVSAGNSMIALNSVARGMVKGNFSATGNDASKYFLYALNAGAGFEFEPPHSPPGQTPPYPCVVSRSGAGGAISFTESATSDSKVPITTLKYLGTGESQPGNSTTTINSAVYTRHANIVTVSFKITLTSKSASSTGFVQVVGLPFSNLGSRCMFTFAAASGFSRTGPWYYGIIPETGFYIEIYDSTGTQVDFQTFVAAGAVLQATFSYQVAQ